MQMAKMGGCDSAIDPPGSPAGASWKRVTFLDKPTLGCAGAVKDCTEFNSGDIPSGVPTGSMEARLQVEFIPSGARVNLKLQNTKESNILCLPKQKALNLTRCFKHVFGMGSKN